MCAIIDNDVISEVFGDEKGRPKAGQQFRKKIDSGKISLVLGGKLRSEITHREFRRWWRVAIAAGRVFNANDAEVEQLTEELDAEVEQLTEELENSKSCKSNDKHIIALAQVSGARLLYTNDGDLQTDFQNRNLINNPEGKIYTTQKRKDYSDTHKRLLRDDNLKNLCKGSQ